MANFSKIVGLASSAMVFAGMAFGQNITCGTATAGQVPLVRVEGTTELVGQLIISCTGGTVAATANILDIVSLPVTSKLLLSSTGATEAVAVLSSGATYTGVVSGSTVSFNNVLIPAGGATITIDNIRVNATSLSVGSGAPPPITESAFISGTANLNSSVTTSVPVAYAFTGLGTQTAYKSMTLTNSNRGSNNFLICTAANATSFNPSAGLAGVIDVKEGFATAFKGLGGAGNATPGSEFSNNTETGYVPAPGVFPGTSSNIAASATVLQVVFTNVPSTVTLYVPTSIQSDQVTGAFLTLVGSPTSTTAITASTSSSVVSGTAAVTATSGTATAYYLFAPGSTSGATVESFAIPSYVVEAANATAATTASLTAAVSFAPVGATSIPSFVVGASTVPVPLSVFSACTTNLLFTFVTNQLGFDTGMAIANTSTDPFGSAGATPQAGSCALSFYGAGAPSPNTVTTPNIPSGTVYTQVLSGLAAGFQGYIIAQCNFQLGHGFAFITDGIGANGGLSQGYLAGIIPSPSSTSARNSTGSGESLGN